MPRLPSSPPWAGIFLIMTITLLICLPAWASVGGCWGTWNPGVSPPCLLTLSRSSSPLGSGPWGSSRVMAYSRSSRGSCSMALRNSRSEMGGGALGAWSCRAPRAVSPAGPALGHSPSLPPLIAPPDPSLSSGSGVVVEPRRLTPAGDRPEGQTACSCFFLFDAVLNFWSSTHT